MIGSTTMYNLEFQLPHIPEHFHLPIPADALGNGSDQERAAAATTSPNAMACSKVSPAALRPRRKCVKWEPKENETILKMKGEGCSWEGIHRALPHRTPGAIQVQYSTKLKKQYWQKRRRGGPRSKAG
jgi:hypothetical protein